MLEKTLGIVLHQIKYGESSLIVHLYTRRWGRMGILIPGARGNSKNRKAYLYQPLTLLELDVYFKGNRELQKIREARNHLPLVHLVADPVKSSIALFLAEVLHKALREEEANTDLFDFLTDHIRFLDLTEEGIANFHLYFLVRLSRFLGFYPESPPQGNPCWFSLESGTFHIDKPVKGPSVDPDLGRLLSRFMKIQPGELSTIQLSRIQRMEFLEVLLRYYHYHLEGLGEIRSHQVLAALFS